MTSEDWLWKRIFTHRWPLFHSHPLPLSPSTPVPFPSDTKRRKSFSLKKSGSLKQSSDALRKSDGLKQSSDSLSQSSDIVVQSELDMEWNYKKCMLQFVKYLMLNILFIYFKK